MTYRKFLKELRNLSFGERYYLKRQAELRGKGSIFSWSNPISIVCERVVGKLHHGWASYAADELGLPREISERIMRAVKNKPENRNDIQTRKTLLSLA